MEEEYMRFYKISRRGVAAGIIAAATFATSDAIAQKNYGPGASDTEIKIGNIMPYSGPASAYGIIGQVETAYFKMVNDQGGINGRKINFISYDDGYSPPKAVEQARKLVESDEVLFIFNSLGTPSNSAIMKYMNAKKVPQLFVATGATKFSEDPKDNHWTMGWQPSYQSEGRIYAKYILANHPNAKIGVLYQNDDFGKDVYKGLKDGLGDKAKSMVAADAPYEVSDPTIDSQILKLKAAGVDLLIDFSTPKFAAQSIKKVAEIGWKPIHIVNNVSASVGSVFKPAGLENGIGVLSTGYLKDPSNPDLKKDATTKDFFAFLDKYMPEADRSNLNLAYGYAVTQTVAQVLKQCGDELTRDNVMKQAANLKDFASPMFLEGIKVNTSPTDYFVLEQLQMMKFNGQSWDFFGPVISGEAKS
jgi:branched-chain amino acid transport system substrate-binding protein